MVKSVLQLRCSCNNYPWGKQGSKSIAARLCEKTPGTDFKIDESKAYAEMWMGTYPDLPSYVLADGQDLQDVINANPEILLGRAVMQRFGQSLPFLPKVLSIAKALPLQLHPNKSLAEKLHKRDPEQFTDPNHKPEIALALGPFEAFVGFKPLEQIESLMKLESLQQFLPEVKKVSFDNTMVKGIVRQMLLAPEDVVKDVGENLRQLPKNAFAGDDYIPDMIPRLWEQYDKTDNGILVALITMNYLQLNAGDSIYIPADGIHAYLSGDIIECMARSNNVLNTGFCPRADRNSVDTFCETLTFSPHSPEEPILKPEAFERAKCGKTKIYSPPMSEFDVLATELGKGYNEVIEALDGPSILIVTKGKGAMSTKEGKVDLSEGYVFFVGAGVETKYEAHDGLQVFRAYAE